MDPYSRVPTAPLSQPPPLPLLCAGEQENPGAAVAALDKDLAAVQAGMVLYVIGSGAPLL